MSGEPAERTAATRRRILEAACEVIADVGFEKVRMRMVAQRAGVSPGLLHYHFESRERLFAEALRHSYEHTGAAGHAHGDGSAGTDHPATVRLAMAIDACLPLAPDTRQDQLLWHELWLRAARDQASRLLALEFYRSLHDWFAGIVRDGIATGEFQLCEVDELVTLLLLLLDGSAIRLTLDDPGFTASAARARIWARIGPELRLPARMPRAGGRPNLPKPR
ncbi:TetR/AcrR family transcriptional regulator [Streptacidiphilus rugosus]|uniref:TetR/AcrR family transcriptional regulator n=1 Tax=Streptacidiphilus rugosus TaxID=405783 RepID=UPI00055D342C|nr:TetR/AcrR family transcriptional regulator [Streptacidiphilus rugosus]